MKQCEMEGCNRPVQARGLCNTHYWRWWKNGTTTLPRKPNVFERFFTKFRIDPSGCWIWTACIQTNHSGLQYAKFNAAEEQHAHRASYRLFIGPIPEDRPHIDHLCSNTLCVKPAHLEAVTVQENNRRTVLRGRGRWASEAKVT